VSSREYGDEDEEEQAQAVCPDCEVGKHLACIGSAWDHVKDEPAVCSCWVDGHRSPLVQGT
jgi:hypothetical protein